MQKTKLVPGIYRKLKAASMLMTISGIEYQQIKEYGDSTVYPKMYLIVEISPLFFYCKHSSDTRWSLEDGQQVYPYPGGTECHRSRTMSVRGWYFVVWYIITKECSNGRCLQIRKGGRAHFPTRRVAAWVAKRPAHLLP